MKRGNRNAPAPAPAPLPPITPPPVHVSGSAGTDIEVARAAREVETAMVVARRFPRDVLQARARILAACSRPALADGATYAYKRGSTLVEGPSIRMAEALAQAWGNMEFGVRELSQEDGKSSVQAYAYDLETNTKQVKNFVVPHVRYSREDGLTRLTDPRDIYEAVANQAARRLRSCILGVIPGDVVDEAVAQCKTTLANSGGAPEEQLKKLVASFAEIGVTADMIAHKLGHSLTKIVMAEVIRLRQTYAAIRDGMTTVSAEFRSSEPQQQSGAQTQAPPKNAREAAAQAAAKAGAGKPPQSFDQFEALVRATPPPDVQTVLDDAAKVLSEQQATDLRKLAERLYGHE